MRPVPAFLIALSLFAGLASAKTATLNATDSRTFTTSGPSKSNTYFDIEGIGNGTNYAAFGVLQFDSKTLGLPAHAVTGVSALTLSISQSNTRFTAGAPNALGFYLTTDNATSIGADSTLAFNLADPRGLANQLSPNYLLGVGDFRATGTGDVDSFHFSLASATPAERYVANTLNHAGDLRVIVAPLDQYVAATYSGVGNTAINPQTGAPIAGPELAVTFSAVPEANPAAFVAFTVVAAFALHGRLRPAARAGRLG